MVVEEVLDERSIKVIHYTGNPDGAADPSCSTSGTSLSSSGSGCGRKGGALGTAAGYLAVKCMEKNGKKLDPSTKLMIEIRAAIGGAFVGGVVGYKAAGYYTDSQMADR
eukprot:Em0022g83a